MLLFDGKASSLISQVGYKEDSKELYVYFNKYYEDLIIYKNVPIEVFLEFESASSFGKFYLSRIKNKFNIKKESVMADKVLKLKIDVKKIVKDWLYVGEKGTYLNVTVLYNEEQDKYETNGLVVQDVPSEIYKQDRSLKGPILGNCKEYGAAPKLDKEQMPGTESGNIGKGDDIADDLPF